MKFFTQEQIEKIRNGFYSAVYFARTQQILLSQKNLAPATMQIFQKKEATICGTLEVSELLRYCCGYVDEHGAWIDKSKEITVEALSDGDTASPWESVLHITGPYAYFAHLESVYLGILARRTKVATNTKRVVEAANGKPVLFFADRFDYFLNQEGDGYAAKLGGAEGVATPAQAFLYNGQALGTIPHSLIAINNGDTVKAAESFANQYPQVPLIILADFDNSCVKTALDVARVFKDNLFGVRLDTSETLIDASLEEEKIKGTPNINGVSALLVKKVRAALDREGYTKVKIIVSGGFDAEKIKHFEEEQTPVDIYGVGSSLLKGSFDFTADIVKVNGKEIAKVGRKFQPNKRLQVIDKK